VSNVLVRADAVEEFRRMSNRKSQELLEDYHQWLTAHEVDLDEDPASSGAYVAVGIYYTENSKQESPS
jgi:hypothetical protein